MKSTTLNKALIALCIFASLTYAVGATADQGVNLVNSIQLIETTPLQPTLEQQQQLTENLSARVLFSCSYCSITSDFQMTEFGRMEVTNVIGGIELLNRSRFASTRLHQISTFNALETHL